MKKIIFLFATILTLHANAQSDAGVFFDLNLGTRFGGVTSDLSTMKTGFHIDGGVGYMFNSYFGVKGGLGFNTFNAVSIADEAKSDRSGSLRGSLQAILSISELANFGTEKFGLRIHSGFGFGTISNPDYKRNYTENSDFEDPALKGNDDVVNVIFGLTPQFHINEKLSVNIDLSHSLFMKQDYAYDRQFSNTKLESGTHGYTTSTIGLSLRL